MQLNDMSDNGNMWLVQENGLTVGQNICTYMADHFFYFIHNHRVSQPALYCEKKDWERSGKIWR